MEALLAAGGAPRRAGVWHLGEAPIHLALGVHAELERADSLLHELGTQLRACGFDVSDWLVDAPRWAELAGTPAAADSFDLLVAAWTPGPTEDWRALAVEAPFGPADPALAAAVDGLHRAATPDEAARAGAALHRHLAEQVPYTFLWAHRAVAAWGPRVSGAPDHAASPFAEVERWRVEPDPLESGRAGAAARE
jgi:hypothetical protein